MGWWPEWVVRGRGDQGGQRDVSGFVHVPTATAFSHSWPRVEALAKSEYLTEGRGIETVPLGGVEQFSSRGKEYGIRGNFQKRRNPHSCIYRTKQRNRTPKSVSQAKPGSRDSSRNPNKSTTDPLVPAKEWESISQYSRLRKPAFLLPVCVNLGQTNRGTPSPTRSSLPASTPRTRSHGSCGSSPAAGQDGTSQQRHDFLSRGTRSVQRIGRSTTCLLFELQPLDDGSELAQNLVGPLVVLGLGGDELGEVAQGLGGIENLGR